MGVTQSQEINNSNDSEEEIEKVEKVEIGLGNKQDEILEKCKLLIRKYKKNFLDKNFCNNIAFVLENSMKEFDIDVLEGMKSNIEKTNVPKKIRMFLSYDVHKNDRFVVESLNEELIDYLKEGDKVDYKKDYIRKLSDNEKISFISNKIKEELLGSKINNQKGGSNNNNNNNSSFFGNDENVNNTNNVKINNVKKNSVKKRNNGNHVKNTVKIQNKNSKYNTKVLENLKKKLNNIKSKKLNQENEYENKDENILINNINVKGNNKGNNNNNKNESINNLNKKINKKEEKLLNRIEKKDQNIEEEINKENEIEKELKKELVNIKNNNEPNLTKDKLCKKIANHYMVRFNIVVAILTALPYKSRDGEIRGFCYSRYNNLNEGKLCIPSGGIKELNKLNKDELLESIKDYINVIEEKECKNKGGYYKILSDLEKESLLNSDYLYNKMYRENFGLLKNSYMNNLNLLLDILDELENNNQLNNSVITLLSEKTKDILTGLYNNCQTYYINSYICLLKADLDMKKTDEINKTLVELIGL